MNTSNPSFNQAWKSLKLYHPSAFKQYPEDFSIDISNKPKLNKKDWSFYISNLIEVITIGKRNNWIHLHVDGKGFISYILFTGEAKAL